MARIDSESIKRTTGWKTKTKDYKKLYFTMLHVLSILVVSAFLTAVINAFI